MNCYCCLMRAINFNHTFDIEATVVKISRYMRSEVFFAVKTEFDIISVMNFLYICENSLHVHVNMWIVFCVDHGHVFNYFIYQFGNNDIFCI
jgi:hypothetical protein